MKNIFLLPLLIAIFSAKAGYIENLESESTFYNPKQKTIIAWIIQNDGKNKALTEVIKHLSSCEFYICKKVTYRNGSTAIVNPEHSMVKYLKTNIDNLESEIPEK